MAKWGKTDYEQFIKLQQNIKKLSDKINMDAFCEDCCKELAARLLASVIPETPVGKYPKGSGKKGGTLRRGWTSKTYKEAVNGSWSSSSEAKTRGAEYANGLNINHAGTMFSVEVINPVEYASYVEFGHRKRKGRKH